jgi:hypothetical protein
VALQLDVNVFPSEDANEFFGGAVGFVDPAAGESGGERAIVAAGQADQSVGIIGDFVHRRGGDGLRARLDRDLGRAQLHARNQPAEVLVAGAARNQ